MHTLPELARKSIPKLRAMDEFLEPAEAAGVVVHTWTEQPEDPSGQESLTPHFERPNVRVGWHDPRGTFARTSDNPFDFDALAGC
jgi:hypothetical protein